MVTRIDAYLDELAGRITGNGADIRAFLLEVEAHLEDTRDAAIARGLNSDEADAEAVALFGDPADVARSENRSAWRSSRGAATRDAARLLARLLSVGLIVIGFAGAAGLTVGRLAPANAVFGLPSSVSMPAALCARWLGLHPEMASCRAAATAEASFDIPLALVAAGAIGVLLGFALLLLEALRPSRRPTVLPRTLGPTIAATMFGAAAVGLAALGQSNAVLFTAWGRGMWWIEAVCSLLAACVALGLLIRALARSRPASARRT